MREILSPNQASSLVLRAVAGLACESAGIAQVLLEGETARLGSLIGQIEACRADQEAAVEGGAELNISLSSMAERASAGQTCCPAPVSIQAIYPGLLHISVSPKMVLMQVIGLVLRLFSSPCSCTDFYRQQAWRYFQCNGSLASCLLKLSQLRILITDVVCAHHTQANTAFEDEFALCFSIMPYYQVSVWQQQQQ